MRDRFVIEQVRDSAGLLNRYVVLDSLKLKHVRRMGRMDKAAAEDLAMDLNAIVAER